MVRIPRPPENETELPSPYSEDQGETVVLSFHYDAAMRLRRMTLLEDGKTRQVVPQILPDGSAILRIDTVGI